MCDCSRYGFVVYGDGTVTDVACKGLNGMRMGDRTLTVRRATEVFPATEPFSLELCCPLLCWLCCAGLCWAGLCCAVLCWAGLCCALLCCAVLCWAASAVLGCAYSTMQGRSHWAVCVHA